MIVADTSALLSVTTIDLLETFLTEFDVHTTETVLDELDETADYDDTHGKATATVLTHSDQITIHDVEAEPFESSRIDAGEGTCALLTNELEADFLITDDLRALPELQAVVDANLAISPIVLRALVQRDVLERDAAEEMDDLLTQERNWLGAPIYRRAKDLFE
jgi:predicted nucleic acid-binding protein